MEINNILRGCSVQFIRSAMRIAKIVNPSTHSLGYQMFMSVAKLIPDNPSKDKVQLAFSVLSGSELSTKLSESLPPPLCNVSSGEVDTVRWSRVQTWTDWWTRPAVLQKLSKAFSSINDDKWDNLPGTNNPVESINRQSTPDNLKSVMLKPLVEHFYLERSSSDSIANCFRGWNYYIFHIKPKSKREIIDLPKPQKAELHWEFLQARKLLVSE